MQLPAAEYISLYRCRDAMGAGLEPTLALLRALKYLLRLADPDYAKTLEKSVFHVYEDIIHVDVIVVPRHYLIMLYQTSSHYFLMTRHRYQ